MRTMIRCIRGLSLAGVVCGIALVVQPLWPAGLRVGFFLTLAATLGHIAASHLPGGATP